MRWRSQSAIEYLFILAATLVLVLFTARVVIEMMRAITNAVSQYIDQVRKQVLENL